MINKKAQMSYEAVFTFGIILLIFVIILSVLISREIDRSNTRDFLENRGECLKLSNEISAVYSLGDKAVSSLRLLKPANITGDIIKVGNFLCNACCNFTKSNSNSFSLSSGYVNLKNFNGNVQISLPPGNKQHHDACSSSSECSTDAPLCCYAHGETVCEVEGHHDCSSSSQTITFSISSTSGNTCDAGCSTGNLNDRDAGYESELDKNDVLPMTISDTDQEGGSVSDVKVSLDYGKAEAGISANSLQLYISDSQLADSGTVYCRATYTPPTGASTASSIFDCEDNPVTGGLNTIAKVDAMYVHIDNEDTGSAQSFKVDWVSVNVTYTNII